MRLLLLLVTCVPMGTFTGAALWCLAHEHPGFAVTFTVLVFVSIPKIGVESGAKGDAK